MDSPELPLCPDALLWKAIQEVRESDLSPKEACQAAGLLVVPTGIEVSFFKGAEHVRRTFELFHWAGGRLPVTGVGLLPGSKAGFEVDALTAGGLALDRVSYEVFGRQPFAPLITGESAPAAPPPAAEHLEAATRDFEGDPDFLWPDTAVVTESNFPCPAGVSSRTLWHDEVAKILDLARSLSYNDKQLRELFVLVHRASTVGHLEEIQQVFLGQPGRAA